VTFADLPAGGVVFLDTNCLVYAATADPQYGPACKRLLERIENKDLQGVTSAHVLGEMAHRVMTIEAALTLGRPLTGMSTGCGATLPMFSGSANISGPSMTSRRSPSLSSRSVAQTSRVPPTSAFSTACSLMMHLSSSIMQSHGLTALASLDADFDQVPGITRYAPV